MKKSYKLTDDDFKRMRKVHSDENKYTDNSRHFYLSYTLRLVLMIIVIVAFLGLSYLCFSVSFAESVLKEINTTEKSSYTYEIVPVSGVENVGNYNSLQVDKVKSVLSYKLETEEEISSFTKYDVSAIMVIEDLTDGSKISENKFELVPKKVIHVENKKEISVEPKLNIPYAEYNKMAYDVIQKYNLKAKATLHVEMNVSNVMDVTSFKKDVVSEQKIVMDIPLCTDNVNVELKDKLDLSQNYSEHVKPKLAHTYLLYLGIALLIVGTVILLLTVNFVLSVRPKKSKYCRLRDGILRDYDRIIVNVKRVPDLKDYNIIDCYSFNELLDAQNLLEKPIIYFEVVRNQKCMFAIIGEQDIYKFVLKECDIDFDN